MKILKMTSLELIRFAKTSSDNEIIEVLSNNIPEEKFKLIFFNINNNLKIKLLDNSTLFPKISLMIKNGLKVKILKNFNDEFILEFLSKINEEDLSLIVKSLPMEKIQDITNIVDKKYYNCNINNLSKLKEKLIMLSCDYDLFLIWFKN